MPWFPYHLTARAVTARLHTIGGQVRPLFSTHHANGVDEKAVYEQFENGLGGAIRTLESVSEEAKNRKAASTLSKFKTLLVENTGTYDT